MFGWNMENPNWNLTATPQARIVIMLQTLLSVSSQRRRSTNNVVNSLIHVPSLLHCPCVCSFQSFHMHFHKQIRWTKNKCLFLNSQCRSILVVILKEKKNPLENQNLIGTTLWSTIPRVVINFASKALWSISSQSQRPRNPSSTDTDSKTSKTSSPPTSKIILKNDRF